jgi:acyl carrier protein
MNHSSVRTLVIDALHKVTEALSKPELAQRLQDPKINVAIKDLEIDSLEAVEWCMEIEERSGVELDPVELTTHRSIDELVDLIVSRSRQAGDADDKPKPVRVSRDKPLPLSFSQERIWKYCQTPKGSAGYMLGMRDHILGALDIAALRDCLSYIVKRHEILRTTFTVLDGSPVQVVHPAEPIALPVFDLSTEAAPKEAADRILKMEMTQAADLTQRPLARFCLVRMGENEHWLFRTCHHILWDAWSTKLLFGELAILYEAKLKGMSPPLPESEPLQLADYAAWQRKTLRRDGPAYQEAVAWWKERFQRQPHMPGLPFKRPAPLAGLDPAKGVISWPVGLELTQRLARLRQQEGVTPYQVWLAALVALLAAEIGQPEVTVGSYVTNRRRADVQNMIGYLTNLATLGFRVDFAMPFRDWLSEVRSVATAAEVRSEIPHEELREQLKGLGVALPEISVIFGAPRGFIRADQHFAGLTVARPDLSMKATMPWGFTVNIHERNDLEECWATFDAGIYDPVGVRRFIDRLLDLLDAASQHPDRPIGELLALGEAVLVPEHESRAVKLPDEALNLASPDKALS